MEGRSANQLSTAKLYEIIRQNKEIFRKNKYYFDVAQGLTSIGFSLWRAVFLSDVDGLQDDKDAQMLKDEDSIVQVEDALRFLQELVLNNMIAYSHDVNSREWSFRYYMYNAKHRFTRIIEKENDMDLTSDQRLVATNTVLSGRGISAMDWWDNHQRLFEFAIINFDRIIKLEKVKTN